MLQFTTAFNGSSRFGNKLLMAAGACVVSQQLNLYVSPEECLHLGGWLMQHSWKDDFLNNFSINKSFIGSERVDNPVINLNSAWLEKNLDITLWEKGRYILEENCLLHPYFIIRYGSKYSSIFEIKQPIEHKDGTFVHFRGGDQPQPSVGTYAFYREALTRLGSKTGFISTDGISFDHPMVNQLVQEFNLTKVPKEYNPVQTLMFARGFRDMVLDRGSYSWWLGTFAQPQRVFCYVPPEQYSWGANTHLAHSNWVPLTL